MILEKIFLYLAMLTGLVILILIGIIVVRINKYIKTVDRDRRNKMVEYIRKTSKHNKQPRKRLKF